MTDKIFSVVKIYTKDISYESPKAPSIFNAKWQPNLDFNINIDIRKIDDKTAEIYEVDLNITVTMSLQEEAAEKNANNESKGSIAFLIEIKQSGIFNVSGFTADELKYLLSTRAAEIVYPYARERVNNLVTFGGFPDLLLPPVNFEAMYAQHIEAAKNNSNSATESSNTTKSETVN